MITADGDLYIGTTFAVPSRAERIVEVLGVSDTMSVAEIIALQGDTTSRPAQAWVRLLGRTGPFADDAETARVMLASWDGNLLPESAPALLYGCFHRRIARALFEPIVGTDVWTVLASGAYPPTGGMIAHWLATVVWSLESTPRAPDGRAWNAVLSPALVDAWQDATEAGGSDPATWRWGTVHRTHAQHTLAGTIPSQAALLNPPRVSVGGDADTVQAAGYGWQEGTPFDITGLSVYRQAIDLSDIAHATSVVPGGVSGLPRTDHYADQLEQWRIHRRVPMWFLPEDVEAATLHRLRLTPR